MPQTLPDYNLPEPAQSDVELCVTEGHVWKHLPHIKTAGLFVGFICSRCMEAEAFTEEEQAAYDVGNMERRT